MTEESAPRGRVDKAKAWYTGQPKGKRYGIGCCGCLGVGFILLMILGLILTAFGVTPDEDDSTDATGEEEAQEEPPAEDEDAEDEAEEGDEADTEEDASITLPDVAGLPADEARDELEEMDLEVEFDAGDSEVWNASNWEVESTDPEAGADVEDGDEVALHVVRPEDHEDESDDEGEEAEAAEEPEELPEGLEAQIERLTEERNFGDAEVYYSEGDASYPYTSVHVDFPVGVGWSESSMCRSARQYTLEGLKFLRDEVEESYDEAVFSFTAEGEADATGESSTLSMATVYYDHETVQAIDDEAASLTNIWEAADDGGRGPVCIRGES